MNPNLFVLPPRQQLTQAVLALQALKTSLGEMSALYERQAREVEQLLARSDNASVAVCDLLRQGSWIIYGYDGYEVRPEGVRVKPEIILLLGGLVKTCGWGLIWHEINPARFPAAAEFEYEGDAVEPPFSVPLLGAASRAMLREGAAELVTQVLDLMEATIANPPANAMKVYLAHWNKLRKLLALEHCLNRTSMFGCWEFGRLWKVRALQLFHLGRLLRAGISLSLFPNWSRSVGMVSLAALRRELPQSS